MVREGRWWEEGSEDKNQRTEERTGGRSNAETLYEGCIVRGKIGMKTKEKGCSEERNIS